jgi:hypothetical protein
MRELIWQIEATKAFTIYTAGTLAVAAFLFFREIANAPMMAVLSVPVLIGGSVIATAVCQYQHILLATDPDANIAAMAGVGAIAGLLLMVLVTWLWTVINEWIVARKKLPPVAARIRTR